MRKFIAQLSDNKKAFFIFLFLLGAVFSRVIVNQQTFFSDVIGLPFRGGAHHYDGPKTFWDLDATNYMHFEVPQTIYWMTELQKGNFAFWNPYQGNGQPLSASITSGIYNPLKLALFFLFPYMKTFDFYLLLRFLIAGFGTYLFLKKIGLSHRSSLLGGIAYMFSAYFVLWITHWSLGADMMTPYLLLGAERLLKDPVTKNVLFLAIAWAIMVLSQNPEAVILVTILALAYFVYRYLADKEAMRTSIFAFIFALGIALVLSFPMIWDTAVFFSQGSTGQGHTAEWVADYREYHSNFPVQLARFFRLPVPPTLFVEASRVGTSTMGEDSIIVTYIGTFVLLLTIAAFSFKNKIEHIPFLIFFGGVILFFILMWLAVPPISWLERLPVLAEVNVFRYVGIFHFALAILAALGFQNIKNQNISPKKFWTILVFLMAPFAGLMAFSSGFRGSYRLVFNETDLAKADRFIGRFPEMLQIVVRWLIHYPYAYAALVFGVTAFFFLLFFFLWKKKMFNLMFLFLVSELVLYMPKWRDTSNFQDPYKEPPFVLYLRSRPDADSYRILPVDRVLMSHVATGYGLKSIGTFEGVLLESYIKSLKPLFEGGFLKQEYEMYKFGEAELIDNSAYPPLFSAASVKYIVSEKPLPENVPYKLIYDNDVKIYENKDALPLTRIETDGGRILTDAAITGREPNRVTIRTSAKEEGMLVLAETNYPGWRVFVDGKEREIETVHITFRGVRLDSGSHEVVFSYWPFSRETLWAIVGRGNGAK